MMSLPLCWCGLGQHADIRDGRLHDAFEIGLSGSEASGAMAVPAERHLRAHRRATSGAQEHSSEPTSEHTSEPETAEAGHTSEPQELESSSTLRTHDSIDSLFFPNLYCCELPATTLESPASLPVLLRASCEQDEKEELRETKGRKPRVVEERDLTQSLKQEVSHMPPIEVPHDPPHLVIGDQHVPDLTLDQVEQALLEDSMLEQYLFSCSKSYDISLSCWGTTPDGIRVRRAHFTMPVPQDLPPALARVVAVPQNSRATLLLGFTRPREDEALVWLQQFTHDVPYGENFRVQETMRFRLHPQGGLTFDKWTLVKWLRALPWLMAPMKPICESKTATGAPAAADAFLDAVRKSVH